MGVFLEEQRVELDHKAATNRMPYRCIARTFNIIEKRVERCYIAQTAQLHNHGHFS